MRPNALIVLLIASIILVGCGGAPVSIPTQSASAPRLSVTETGSADSDAITETIHMNNCGGKADVKQTADRYLTVTVEGESGLGVDVQVIQANLSARYAERKGVSKSIELTAPAGTDMEFTLAWTEQQWLGTVTSSVGPGEVKYRARVPVAVELVQSRDLHCDGGDTAQVTSSQEPIAAPPPVQPTEIAPTATIPPPQPTAPVDTPPGTILEVGQSWRQGGYEVEMVSPYFTTDFTPIIFNLISRKSETVAIEYSLKQVSATDNQGKRLQIDDNSNYPCENQRITLKPKEKVSGLWCYGAGGLYVHADFTDPSITEIIVSFSGTLGFENARWRIPVAH